MSSSTSTKNIHTLVLCAFFTTLTAIGSQIQIPLPMIPINLALFSVCLTGALLGPKYGSLSMIAYMLLGAVGAPVFNGFTGGIGILIGKTGGYVIGYIICAMIVGALRYKFKSFWGLCFSMLLGVFACYFFGTIWFMVVTKLNLWSSLLYCVFPFLIGDFIKILLAAVLVPKLNKILVLNHWNIF